MATDITTQALDKIARLKELAARPGTAAEAAAATKAIHRLMLKFGISELEVEKANVDQSVGYENERYSVGGNNNWRKTLFNAVSEYMFCRSVFDWKGEGVSVVGRRENIIVAKSMYEYLVGEIDRLADVGSTDPMVRMMVNAGMTTNRRWKGSFRTGAAYEMASRLKTLRKENVEAENASALVVVEQDALNKAFREYHPDVKNTTSKAGISDSMGLHAGRNAAKGINLASQLEA